MDAAKELELILKTLVERLKTDVGAIRGNRPSVEMVENISVSAYDQTLQIKQMGSLSIAPPRDILITLWDKTAAPAVAKAIETARLGLSISVDGNMIRASLSSLGDERRAELTKTVKRAIEEGRIQVRSRRDDAMKKIKAAEGAKEMSEDAAFKMKERVQKITDEANESANTILEKKLAELGE